MSKNIIRQICGTLLQIAGVLILFLGGLASVYSVVLAKLNKITISNFLILGISIIVSMVIGYVCFSIGKKFPSNFSR